MSRFKDRSDAARQLIPYLAPHRYEDVVLMAIPRGGVAVAYPIALQLHFKIELLMTKKIGHPLNPEFAIGAVSPEDEIIDMDTGTPGEYVQRQVSAIRTQLQQRYVSFTGQTVMPDLKDKVLIIIDDGMATGNTVLSSIAMLRNRQPAKVVVAVPVASREAVQKLKPLTDELICLYQPDFFRSVGEHYEEFCQVEDVEVSLMLKKAREHAAH